MDSSDSSLRFRVCEVSQVPVRTFDTRPPALPRPLHTSYVVRRRTILASSIRRDWPADRDLHEALTHGSLALELMSSSDKTPARQSPSARLIFLLTFRHLYEISTFQLTSSAKLVLAYPNLGLNAPHPASYQVHRFGRSPRKETGCTYSRCATMPENSLDTETSLIESGSCIPRTPEISD